MATIEKFMSDVVLGSVMSSDLGFSFEEVTVTWSDGMEAGAFLELSGDTYIWVETANVANTVAVLADVQALPSHPDYDDLADGTTYTMNIAKRGVTVNYNELTLSDSTDTSVIDTAVPYFEAAGMNKVTDKFVG